MSRDRTVEVCCGCLYDVKCAVSGGADRIELNSGLYLGGLTPSLSALEAAKKVCEIPVVAMLRPRGGGFCYLDDDFQVMVLDLRKLIRAGADGIAFGCLDKNGILDYDKNKRIVDMVKEAGKEAVFHRAFDCCADPVNAVLTLIEMGADRILTSGGSRTAWEGRDQLLRLQQNFGGRIQFLAGCGVNAGNAAALTEYTGISQVHSSCKEWLPDPTTIRGQVSFGYGVKPWSGSYDVVSEQLVRELVLSVSVSGPEAVPGKGESQLC